jgi:hypothetical protein
LLPTAKVFLLLSFLFLLQKPASATSLTNYELDGQALVDSISSMVMPEIKNYAATAIGIVAALLLVRSFK